MKNQQRFILEEEVSVSLKELAAILNPLRQFLKQYDKAVKFSALYALPKPRKEIRIYCFFVNWRTLRCSDGYRKNQAKILLARFPRICETFYQSMSPMSEKKQPTKTDRHAIVD